MIEGVAKAFWACLLLTLRSTHLSCVTTRNKAEITKQALQRTTDIF